LKGKEIYLLKFKGKTYGMIIMNKIFKNACIVLGMSFFFLFVVFGEDAALAKVLTIGIINALSTHTSVIDGFKTGMAELGYIEGKNVKYIYDGIIVVDNKVMYDEARKLVSQNIDMLLTVANGPALQAKKAVEGTDIPVLAAACSKVIEIGLVKELKHPGGNVTGVQAAGNTSKALEWLVKITPYSKKIYLPYNPADDVSVFNLTGLKKIADQLGVELVLSEVRSVDEAVIGINNLPKDISAIFIIPSQTLGPRNNELSQAAIKRRLPMGSALPLNETALITFGSDLFAMGLQTARLAHQIRQGVKPSDLPIETAEVFLTINLKTAEKLGLHVPDDILAQAKKIIR
jgi:putative tryptophan/tyrosine transport system substrate-binding protein